MNIFRQFFSQYSKSFWIFIAAVIILTAVTSSVNNSLLLARNNLNRTAADNAAKVEHFITMVNSAAKLRKNTYDGGDPQVFAEGMRQFLESAYPNASQIIVATRVEPVDTVLSYSAEERLYWYRSYDEESRRNYFTLSEPVLQNGRQTARNLFYFDEQVFLRYFFPGLRENEGITLLAPGNQALLGDMSILTEQNEEGQLAFVNLDGGFTFIQSRVFTPEMAAAGRQMLLFGAALVFCVFLIQPNKRWGASPFELLIRTEGARQGYAASARLLLFMSLIVSIVFLILFHFIIGGLPYIFAVYLFVLLVAVLAFILQLRGLLSGKLIPAATYAMMIIPFALSLLQNDFGGDAFAPIYVWTFLSVLYALYCYNGKKPEPVFKILSLLLFPEIIARAVIVGSVTAAIMEFAFHSFLFAFVLFASFEIYAGSFMKSYSELQNGYAGAEKERERLKNAEKTAELGRMLAGEIRKLDAPANDAKKAAARLKLLGAETPARLIAAAKNFSEEDIFIFNEFIKLSLLALEKEKKKGEGETEGEERVLKKYFEAVQVNNSGEIVKLLTAAGIYDLEKCEENLDFFRRDNIAEILRAQLIVFPALEAVSEIGVATGRIMERQVKE